MSRSNKLLLPVLISVSISALASTACMLGWWGADLDRPSLALADLRASQDQYNDDCARWDDPNDAGDAPDRHVDDVYVMTDDMLDACNDLMGAGRISRADRDRIADMQTRMRDAVDVHRGRFADLTDGTAMHDECNDHNREMLDLFDETEDDLRTGGMMGGRGMM